MSETRFGPPLWELTKARLREFLREPGALFWVFVFPLLMALVLGFAFRDRPPERIPVGVTQGKGSRDIRDALTGAGTVRPILFLSPADGFEALRTGKIALLVECGPPLVYRFDPTRPDARVARLEANEAIQRAHGREDTVSVQEEAVREKGSRYIDFLLPGILGLNLMGTGMWGIGFAIVTSRIKKTLKLLVATPMRKRDYLLCHMIARLVFLVFEMTVILVFGRMIFEVPIRGSLAVLSLASLLGAMCFSGIGLLTTARARSLEVASGLMNFVMLPMWLVSGTFFSIERFPASLQPVIRVLPLTALNDALRAVMLEGKGIESIGTELAVLAIWGAVSFAVALRIFRWQ
jgi:ABC-2 type transport system permease protein